MDVCRRETLVFPHDVLFPEIVRLLDDGHAVTLRTKGNNMFPLLVGGRDCVVLRKPAEVRRGDIVLVHLSSGAYLLHRVYRCERNVFRLMGDANLCATETCSFDEICGVVTEIIRRNRRIACNSPAERYRVWLWMQLRPVRWYLLAVCRWKARLHGYHRI